MHLQASRREVFYSPIFICGRTVNIVCGRTFCHNSLTPNSAAWNHPDIIFHVNTEAAPRWDLGHHPGTHPWRILWSLSLSAIPIPISFSPLLPPAGLDVHSWNWSQTPFAFSKAVLGMLGWVHLRRESPGALTTSSVQPHWLVMHMTNSTPNAQSCSYTNIIQIHTAYNTRMPTRKKYNKNFLNYILQTFFYISL